MALGAGALYNYTRKRPEEEDDEGNEEEEDESLVDRVVDRLRSAPSLVKRDIQTVGSVVKDQIGLLRKPPSGAAAERREEAEGGYDDEAAAEQFWEGPAMESADPRNVAMAREEAMLADASARSPVRYDATPEQKDRRKERSGKGGHSRRSSSKHGDSETTRQRRTMLPPDLDDVEVDVEVPRDATQVLNISAGCLFQFKQGLFKCHHAGPLMALICGKNRHYVLLLYNFKRERVLGVELGSSFLCGFWNEDEDNFFVPEDFFSKGSRHYSTSGTNFGHTKTDVQSTP